MIDIGGENRAKVEKLYDGPKPYNPADVVFGPFDPILAYCRERLKQAPTVEAKAELASVIVLCEGLNRQQELINSRMDRIYDYLDGKRADL